MSKLHEIFPLVIYQETIKNHKKIKEKYLEEMIQYSSYENFPTPENSGNIFLHTNKKYDEIFKEIKLNIDEYFNLLEIDFTKLNYHVVKSWVNYYQDNITPSHSMHTHNESNISFCYYLKTDETSDKFCVNQLFNRNESIEGMFETSNYNLIKKYNKYNCDHYTITPTEGSIILFPSNARHYTKKIVDRKTSRVSLSGDIRVTLKEKHYKYHQGCTHPSQWTQL